MTPTDALRKRLRRLLDERIPAGGSDTDTRFTDDEIDELLEEACCIYGAAAAGWTEKAAMAQREMGKLEQMTTGQETYRYTGLKDRIEYALAMADRYAEMDKCSDAGGGSRLLRVARPEVL